MAGAKLWRAPRAGEEGALVGDEYLAERRRQRSAAAAVDTDRPRRRRRDAQQQEGGTAIHASAVASTAALSMAAATPETRTKALFRRATAFLECGQADEARQDLRKLRADDARVQELLRRISNKRLRACSHR